MLRAGSRLYVQQGSFDEVVNGVAEIAKSIKLGPGLEQDTQMGPLVSDEQLRRVTGYVQSGMAEGAKAVVGGGAARRSRLLRRADRAHQHAPGDDGRA